MTTQADIGTKKFGLGGGQTKNPKNNVTGSKRAGTNMKEQNLKMENIELIFKGLVPKDLRKKIEANPKDPKLEEKKDDKKVEGSSTLVNKALGETDKKEELGTQVYSEISDEDTKKDHEGKKARKALTEEELKQPIYITLTETNTTFFFYTPSTTLITNPKARKFFIFSI